MIKEYKLRYESEAPLLMHSNRGINPLNKLSQQISIISSKRKKTEDDHREMFRLNWENAIYFDKELGPYVPAENIEANLRVAGTKNKRGTDIKRGGMRVKESKIKLLYDGPRDLESLYGDGDTDFVDLRPATNPGSGSGVMACRPRFNRWAIEFTLLVDTDVFNESGLIETLENAQNIGLCDFRERYGKFTYKFL